MSLPGTHQWLSLHVFDRIRFQRIWSTNVIFGSVLLTEMDYYLPLKLVYSQLLSVLCLLLLTLSAFALSG